MTISKNILAGSGAVASAYEIEQSLNFNWGDDSALKRTLSTTSNRRTWTASMWIKRHPNTITGGTNHTYGVVWGSDDGAGAYFTQIVFNGAGHLDFTSYHYDLGATFRLITNRIFRDGSAWFHLVFALDTTQGTVANRMKMYINGVLETSFSTRTDPAQNRDSWVNLAGGSPTQTMVVGNGYLNNANNVNYQTSLGMAELNFIDGIALTPSAFGETNSDTGQWIPKEYEGSYGTNGYYLPFKDSNGGSAYFNGNTVLTAPDSADWDFGSGEFTVESWVYPTRLGFQAIVNHWADYVGSNIAWFLCLDGANKWRFEFKNGSSNSNVAGIGDAITSSGLNKWYHIAAVRSGNTTTLYVDGTAYGQTVTNSGTINNCTDLLRIGYAKYVAGYAVLSYLGNISNVRVVKGSAVYTGNFTPSTAPLTNITNTKLLMNGGINSIVGPTLTAAGAVAYSVLQPFASSVTSFPSDASGQGNNFSGISVVNSDVVTDSPTNNFATWNNIDLTTQIKMSEGNLKVIKTVNAWDYIFGTMAVSTGKWYWEMTAHSDYNPQDMFFGIANVDIQRLTSLQDRSAVKATGFLTYNDDGTYMLDAGSRQSYGATITDGVVLALALDLDNGTAKFYRNNSALASIDISSSALAGKNVLPIWAGYYTGANWTFDFGQKGFTYAPPSGYLALCTKNLPEPTITPSEHFNTVLYTGTGSTAQNVTGVGFQPDFVWAKNRASSGTNYVMYDSVRGPNKTGASSTTNAQSSDGGDGFSAFGSDGFTLKELTTAQGTQNTGAMVAWNWKAGGSAPTKTYTVKVVSDSGNKYRFDDFAASAQTVDLQEGGTYTFDQSDSSNSGHPFRLSTTSNGTHASGSEYTTGVVTYGTPGNSGAYTKITVAASTATLYYYCSVHSGMGGQVNTNSTFGSTNFDGNRTSIVSANQAAGFSVSTHGHNLATSNTFGHGLGVAPEVILEKKLDVAGGDGILQTSVIDGSPDYLRLNTTAAKADGWSGLNLPTSTVYNSSVGSGGGATSVITWAFVSKPGFSKMGVYTGNGNVNGPFVYTDFRVGWIMIKKTNATNNWIMFDNKRDVDNVATQYLLANSAQAEAALNPAVDFVSNGFKIRNTGNAMNTNAGTYFYMAFAEAPFKYANAG